MPILRLATPKTMRKAYRFYNKIPHAAYRELGCREPSCHPNRSITIRAKNRNVLILICFQYRFRRMSIRIRRTNRDDRILWPELPKPVRIQRATRSVMGHFQYGHRLVPFFVQPPHSGSFNIGRKKDGISSTLQSRDDGQIVQYGPAMGLSRRRDYRCVRWIENVQSAPTGLQQVLTPHSGVLIDMSVTKGGFEIFREFLCAFYSTAPVPPDRHMPEYPNQSADVIQLLVRPNDMG